MNSLAITNDPVLQETILGYHPVGFIRDQIFPKIRVSNDTGDILTGGASHLRIINNNVGHAGLTPVFDYSVTKADSWLIEEHRLQGLVTKDDKKKWGGWDKAERMMAKAVHYANMVQAEYGISVNGLANATTMAGYTAALSGTSKWSDYDESSPITDIAGKIATVEANCGVVPNVAICPWNVNEKLKYHPQILDKLGFKYNKIGGATSSELASVFGFEKWLVPTAKYNSAAKGQTKVLTNFWNKVFVMLVVNTNPDPTEFEATCGITYEGDNPVLADTYMVDDPPEARYVREEMDYDDVIVDASAGYLLTTVIA